MDNWLCQMQDTNVRDEVPPTHACPHHKDMGHSRSPEAAGPLQGLGRKVPR